MSDHVASAREAVRTGNGARAVFVLGAPRSGTAMIARFLGSSPDVFNLAEYGAFHFAHTIGPNNLRDIPPGPHREEYLRSLIHHARGFAEEIAARHGSRWYVDATPANLLGARSLALHVPDAVYVVTLRHYAGNIQSMRRSLGPAWTGRTWEDTARIWASLYEHVAALPAERVIPFGFDLFARTPEETLADLEARLSRHGFDATTMNPSTLSVGGGNRRIDPQTVDTRTPPRLQPFSSVDLDSWTGDIHRVVWPVVRDIHHELLRRFPGIYICPEAPNGLRVYDDRRGLVPLELEGW